MGLKLLREAVDLLSKKMETETFSLAPISCR